MEQKTLSFVTRTEKRKGPVGRLRRAGKIPSIIYGSQEPKAISVDDHEFHTTFKQISESTIITLESEESSHEVLVKDFQNDALSGQVLHVDFYEIEKGKLLRTHVSIQLLGTSLGVREGGILEVLSHEVEVECLPKDLPAHIEVDISEVVAGHSIHVRDIEEIEGVRFLNSPDQVICTVQVKRAEEEEEEVEEEDEEGLGAEISEEAAEETGE